MIWFPNFVQDAQKNCYFEIRDVDIQFRNQSFNGMVTGILGIESAEFLTEIRLGSEYDVQIFPVWNDDGHVEHIPESIDLVALKKELSAEIENILPDFYPVRHRVGPHCSSQTSFLPFGENQAQAA